MNFRQDCTNVITMDLNGKNTGSVQTGTLTCQIGEPGAQAGTLAG